MIDPEDDDFEPEDNSEQDDDDQAQDVAEDALALDDDLAEDSEHGGRPNPAQIIPDDVPDLVDRMDEMLRSGIIDNSAFEGEPMHDDEEDMLGLTDPRMTTAIDRTRHPPCDERGVGCGKPFRPRRRGVRF